MDDNCRQVRTELEVFLDGECPQHVEHTVREHLGDCPGCMDRADFEREVRILVAARCRQTAPTEVVDRIVAHLRDQVLESDG